MSYLRAVSLDQLDIVHGFFTRDDGVSRGEFASRNVKQSIGDTKKNVMTNRNRCLKDLQLDDHPFIYAKLCHGKDIYVVTGEESGHVEVEQFDAVISEVPYVTIGLSTADCVPILLADKKRRAVAVVHAGWRGLDNNIIAETVLMLDRLYGISAHNIVAAVGPAIHQMSYEVGQEVASKFWEQFTIETENSLYLDLLGISVSQLKQAGISDIELQSPNTASDKRFFSFRAENAQTGRQLTAICLTP